MQQDLDFFADTQSSQDVPPASVFDDSYCWGNDCHGSYNSHGNDGNLYDIAMIRPAVPSVITTATTRYRHQRQRHYLLKQRAVQRKITATASPSMLKSSNRTNQSLPRTISASATPLQAFVSGLREQALQRTAFEMTEKSKRMEANMNIQDLEREIKWLKALVVEKSEGRLAKLVSERPIPTAHQYTPAAYPPANSMSSPQQDLLRDQKRQQ
ncbi:hypothetical protein BDB00DRAFT_879843 [Zychaea mexicana]|uniref:uncharacterized protein n=1 Tax=Zychaea mexicana TaxID=64656 RepID=UPI0022FF036B|nr:uncharacterized protein BDB00DRAFT_879843 [Zychaea mexicana]KAI9472911.1 hypothetical protein BDB00DRAFT_879843 [Zychaea mexicana]